MPIQHRDKTLFLLFFLHLLSESQIFLFNCFHLLNTDRSVLVSQEILCLISLTIAMQVSQSSNVRLFQDWVPVCQHNAPIKKPKSLNKFRPPAFNLLQWFYHSASVSVYQTSSSAQCRGHFFIVCPTMNCRFSIFILKFQT